MTGVLDGINESLKGYENPIETMDENTAVKIEIDPEKLYYNMVEAKATWLYGLPQWETILTEEKRNELYKAQKASGTVRREGIRSTPTIRVPAEVVKNIKSAADGISKKLTDMGAFRICGNSAALPFYARETHGSIYGICGGL